ncbi:MAG: hypothetical protein FWG67_10110 [Defluviitaleaceae bacterium]|nr:hypothetical protein [Defluviitaleaceae bacterium]
MKKIGIIFICLVIVFMLLGFKSMKDKLEEMKQPEHEKIEDARGILDQILEHIAKMDSELSFEDKEMLDAELGVPRFDILPFSEIKHFDQKDVIDGYIVRPVVEVDNPRLLVVLEAVDKEASVKVKQAMAKLKSDQWTAFKDHGIWTKYLVNGNQTVRQGNFLIYVTWEKAEDIVKVFERHVR